MSLTVWQALARCALTETWPVGMCDNFCANMFGYTFSGYTDAVAHWEALPAADRHSGDRTVPAGMLAFWGGGHGHVAVSDGQGAVWSTDISGAGTVSRVPLSRIEQQWGRPYLGWGEPVFQGIEWSNQMIKGVDVSRYQDTSGWESGVDFAFVKVTEGTTYTNPSWVAQRDTARAAGLVVGYYHFARPGSMTAQADFFLSKIALRPGDVLCLDWEDTGVSNSQKDAWIKYVQGKTGHRVVLYCNTYFWLNLDGTGFAGDGLWVATAGYAAGHPPISAPWLIHQYSTAGNLDHDIAQFDSRAAMSAWAGGEDVSLTADDKAWIKAAVYEAVYETDTIPAPDTSPTKATNPTWKGESFGQNIYDLANEAKTAATDAFLQGQTNEARLAQLKAELDEVKAAVVALNLAGVADAVGNSVAAKLAALKFEITEG